MNAEAPAEFRCAVAARWLPRVLAASVLVAGYLALTRIDADTGAPMITSFRALLVVLVAGIALWVLRKGGEARIRIEVGDGGLALHLGQRWARLDLADVDAVRYEAPFGGSSRSWLPAAVLIDREGRDWRLSGLLASGPELIDEIVRRSGREDLAAWVDAQRVRERMSGAARRVGLGYLLCAGVLAAAIGYAIR